MGRCWKGGPRMEPSGGWSRWLELPELERRRAIVKPDFWQALSEEQRRVFLEEGDWQEIRMVPGARTAKLESLVPLDQICSYLELTPTEVFWLMSTRKLPG